MAAVLFSALIAHDVMVPPQRAFGARVALSAIGQYQRVVSPRIGGVVLCRFRPTCSVYGRESIRKRGLLVGGARAAWRIARCGPWTKVGTVDIP